MSSRSSDGVTRGPRTARDLCGSQGPASLPRLSNRQFAQLESETPWGPGSASCPRPSSPWFIRHNRAGGFLAFVCSGGAMFGMFFFLTQFVQNVLDMNPIQAGLAFLPTSLGAIVVPRTLTPRLVKRYNPKTPVVIGLLTWCG
ncbi:MFS transporter [Streptomyces sp. NPDC058330]|uniref:MFS transporter n=1 Tax=Streptomyces sp. NPDC058330 TaxID=3346449 RepID=UPI0036E8CD06